jgi:hypothetical protein
MVRRRRAACRQNSAAGECSGGSAANAATGAATGRKTELMAKPVIVVTGVSGNLGSRLLPLLGSYSVIGVDVSPPQTESELQFEKPRPGPGIVHPGFV